MTARGDSARPASSIAGATGAATVLLSNARSRSCALILRAQTESAVSKPLLASVDHLVYATPNFNRTVDALTRQIGIAPSAGGAHPGRGTRNALLALGPASYLEIIGPDRDQPDHVAPRWFGIDALTAPRFVTWAAKGTDLGALCARALAKGVLLGDVASGSRQRPDGSTLSWQLTNPAPLVDDGIVPFFIDWGTSPHPSTHAARGLVLVGLRAEHPRATGVRTSLESLGFTLDVRQAALPALVATIEGPRGQLVVR
jgi:hypothetical protein